MFISHLKPIVLFEAEGGGAGGTMTKEDIERMVAAAIAKNGDPEQYARTLYEDNYRLREDKRKLNEQLSATQKNVVPEGAKVLSGDDLKVYESIIAIGKKPEEITQSLSEIETLRAQNNSIKKDVVLRDIADVMGYNINVLKDRDERSGGLSYEIKEVDTDNGKQRQVFVKHKESDKEDAPLVEKPLSEYAEKFWADFLPALKKEQQAQGVAPSRLTYPPQGAGKPDPKKSVSESIMESRYGWVTKDKQ